MVLKGTFHCLHRRGLLLWKSVRAWAEKKERVDKVEEEYIDENREKARKERELG